MVKRILVIGFARSGAAVAQLLINEGAVVTVSDPNLDIHADTVAALQAAGVKFAHAQDTSLLADVDLIVKNPGIPYTIPILLEAQKRGIEIVVEVAAAQRYIQGEWIAITGSNGKTTTTEMVAAVLRRQATPNHRVYVAGNIGTPVAEVAPKMTATDTLVTELSSFQLTGTPAVHPHIAILTNIFASHLDWHGTRQNYIDAKMNITRNQTKADYFLINWDNLEWRELAAQSPATVVPISRQGLSQAGGYQVDGKLYFKTEYIMDAATIGVPGDHNIDNALMAIAVGRLSGVPIAEIVEVLKNFTGVEHRLQLVREVAGRKVYNDSKATDIEATQMALSGFKTPVVLLAGGLDRGDDQMRLAPEVQQHVRAVVTFGQTGPKVAEVANSLGLKTVAVPDATQAFGPAMELSEPGDIILLSPAAASWDQFPDFETRGDLFVQAVDDYIANNAQ
ncbi:MAG: UDP-N-acetylmuramoyl-L-alanine--D-glutamate ligase [Lactobacillaceae bacterium]|nr:UDP-N-acetylmuramoyl-L-alanine--D-glutamate ligase [Lactobacillaceae bacterium]